MNPKTPSSGSHEFHLSEETIYAMARRQDALCLFLLGRTIDGESIISVEPTSDSWCGRIATEVKQINDIAVSLKERFAWGAAAIVGAGAVINLTIVIWQHYSK